MSGWEGDPLDHQHEAMGFSPERPGRPWRLSTGDGDNIVVEGSYNHILAFGHKALREAVSAFGSRDRIRITIERLPRDR